MRNPSKSSSAGVGSAANKVATPCCSKVGMKRGPWTPEEDELLSNYINREGEGRWRTLPKRAGLLRCGKSCRLRWMNYLRPSVKRGHISPDEEDLILRLHRLLGNRWSLIAGRIPGRTDNDIKNYWNTHLSKKLINQGIDPRTHKPLNPNYSTTDDHNNKPSSSKANHISNPNPNPNPNNNNNNNIPSSASEDQPMVTGGRLIGDNGNDYEGASINQNQSTQEDDDINYCTDDVFSSFLNSLINEDFFKGSEPAYGSDPLISSNLPMFSFGAGWDSPIISSGSAFNQNEPKRLNEHVEKHF